MWRFVYLDACPTPSAPVYAGAWDHALHAQLVAGSTKSGATAIAFRCSIQPTRRPSDPPLAQAIRAHDGWCFFWAGGPGSGDYYARASEVQPVLPIRTCWRRHPHWGFSPFCGTPLSRSPTHPRVERTCRSLIGKLASRWAARHQRSTSSAVNAGVNYYGPRVTIPNISFEGPSWLPTRRFREFFHNCPSSLHHPIPLVLLDRVGSGQNDAPSFTTPYWGRGGPALARCRMSRAHSLTAGGTIGCNASPFCGTRARGLIWACWRESDCRPLLRPRTAALNRAGGGGVRRGHSLPARLAKRTRGSRGCHCGRADSVA